jgi:hydrocephalus-inducing protein
MKSIPIYASCDVPKVKLSDKILKYDKVFLRDSKTKTLSLINESNLPARFKIIPQSPETQMIAKFHTEIDEGVIPPLGLVNLGVTLTTFSITEEVRLDLLIKIIANEDIIHTVKLQAISQGPQVKVKEPYINFGDVEVLEETYRTIHISNECSIRADFYAFTKLQNSIFKPIQRHHFLEPHSSMEIEICCVADDTKVFNDTLHFVIKEGLDKEVKLTAKGVGKTIFCKEPLDLIDFQTQYTFRQQTKEIFIENKGRRDQKLEWVRKKPDKKKEEDDKKPQSNKKKEVEEEPTPTFSIFPVVQDLPAKKGLMFQFRAVSTKKGKVSEKFILMSTIEGDRKATPLYETEVTGEFINPKLNFDIQHVVFTYDWVKGVPPKMISQNIGITCDSVLPTKFKLIVEKPFSIFPESFDLSAYKKVAARIDFDPTFNSSKRSCVEKRQLKVKHSKHPFVEAIDVVGVFNFPNLELEVHEINFGSVLNDTSKKYVMKMKNVSLMNVEYQWSFLDEENREDEKESIPINEIFDILPLNGTLEPGQVENVEFVYYGLPNKRFESVAICQIEGGPDERVSLVGESSKIDYKLSIHGLKNVIDFGDQAISQWGAKDFRVENLGKVPFDFKIRMDNIVRKGLVKIVPSSGKIAGGSQSRIRINYCPGLPGDYLESFKIQIAHFEAETITLRGYGLYPALKFELNRVIDAETKKRLEEDRYGLENISLDSNATNLTKKYPEGEVISNLDRKILSDAVMKCLEDRAKGIGSLNSSFADLNQPQQDQTANPAISTVTNNASATAKSGMFRNTSTGAFEKNLYDRINVGTYSIDLGNVIAGSSIQYQFRVYNVGKLPSITINFDQKNIRPAGFRLSNDRFILKNKDKNYEDVRVILQTKKSSPTGRQYFQLPIEIQNGPKYSIDLYCNVTVPELGLSDMEVNFDKVICGQKKIITLRISNDKEVDCNWSILPKKEQRKKASDPKADNRYTINPSFGTLSAFTKQNIEVTFIPTSDKNYTYTFEVNMQDNQRKLELKCSGDGVVPNLIFGPEETIFDPCLPYDSSCYKCFEIKNQSDFDVELFSLDFDKQFLDEEKMIQSYEPLQKTESLSINVRKPGDPFWRDIKSYYNILQDNIKLNLEINKIKETKELKEEEKIAQIEELEKTRKTVQEEIKYPNPISEHLRRNVILWGPRKSGKTQLAKFLSKEHQRGIINFNEILDWNINSGTPSGKMAQEYLAKRKEEMELLLVEKEKAKKKKKKGQEEENYFLERFGWVTDEILAQLLIDRMKMNDSNVGNIFDNLYGNFFENELVALKAILEACKNTTAQLVNLGLCINEKGSVYCPIINPLLMDGLERENILENSPPEEKKNKKLVDRKTIEKNRHEKELAEKEARMNKKNDKKKKEVEEIVAKPIVDPYLPLFEVDEIGELNEAERKAHIEKTNEIVEYFNGRLGEDKIHKLENYLKKLEEEEEAKNTKDKNKQAKDKEKDKSKGNSNLNSRPLTGKEYKMEDKVEELNPVRVLTNTTIEYNFRQLNLKVRSLVPKVDFPDPVSLPIPDDQVLQIMRRKDPRKPKAKLEFFEIFTPEVYIKESYIESKLNDEFKEELLSKNSKVDELENKIQAEIERLKEEVRAKREEERRREEDRDESLPQSPPTDDLIESKDIPESAELKSLTGERAKILQEFEEKVAKRKKELMGLAKVDFDVAKLQSMYRWIVPKHKSIVLVLKFFSKKAGEFPNFLEFDNIYSNGRTTKYKIKGVCDFPKICTNPLKVFANRRQTQPTTLPDSLINKIFYLEENRFDFGPLLIGKKDKDKNDRKVLGMNSYTFDIINEGLYKSNITFDLASNVIEDPEYKKDIFSIHPNFMELEVGQTEKIRVWCVPDEVRQYKEELICMMNHNPVPYVVKMTAQGASPILSVNQKLIEFDRLLVNQTLTKTLVIKNVGPIGAKWKLVGLESLPKEYQFSITSGELRPTKEIQVDIKFSSTIQKKFENEVKVFIEDNEEIGVTQESIVS